MQVILEYIINNSLKYVMHHTEVLNVIYKLKLEEKNQLELTSPREFLSKYTDLINKYPIFSRLIFMLLLPFLLKHIGTPTKFIFRTGLFNACSYQSLHLVKISY